MFEGVRASYLESVADDATGMGIVLALGLTAIGAVIGLGRGFEALGAAVSRKKSAVVG